MKVMSRLKNHHCIAVVGGWCFIVLATLHSIYRFKEPVLMSDDVNTKQLLDAVSNAPWAWALLPFVSLLLIPAALGFYSALRTKAPVFSGFAFIFMCLSSIFQSLSLSRFYIVHYNINEVAQTASHTEKIAMFKFVEFLETYLGMLLGIVATEGFLCLGLAFLVSAMQKTQRFPQWLMSFVSLVALWQFFAILRVGYPSLIGIYHWGEALLFVPMLYLLLGGALLFFKQPREKKLAHYPAKTSENKKLNFLKRTLPKRKKK